MMTFDPNWECKHGVALELNRTCMQCAEERGYQRGLAERDAELATAKARIVALGVEGDEMDQKHLDELRERDERVRGLEAALRANVEFIKANGWTVPPDIEALAAARKETP